MWAVPAEDQGRFGAGELADDARHKAVQIPLKQEIIPAVVECPTAAAAGRPRVNENISRAHKCHD